MTTTIVRCSACGSNVTPGAQTCAGYGLTLAPVAMPQPRKRPLFPLWFWILCGLAFLFCLSLCR